jgi:hypothetical protein
LLAVTVDEEVERGPSGVVGNEEAEPLRLLGESGLDGLGGISFGDLGEVPGGVVDFDSDRAGVTFALFPVENIVGSKAVRSVLADLATVGG